MSVLPGGRPREVALAAVAGALDQGRVVRVVVGDADSRVMLEAIDEYADPVALQETFRADHLGQIAASGPILGGSEERLPHLGVVFGVEKVEERGVAAPMGVVVAILQDSDPPDRLPVSFGQEEIGVGMLVEGVSRRFSISFVSSTSGGTHGDSSDKGETGAR